MATHSFSTSIARFCVFPHDSADDFTYTSALVLAKPGSPRFLYGSKSYRRGGELSRDVAIDESPSDHLSANGTPRVLGFCRWTTLDPTVNNDTLHVPSRSLLVRPLHRVCGGGEARRLKLAQATRSASAEFGLPNCGRSIEF